MDLSEEKFPSGQIGQFDSGPDRNENKNESFGGMSIAQHKSIRVYIKVILIIVIVSVVLLLTMAAGLISIHIRYKQLQNDLEQIQMLTGKLEDHDDIDISSSSEEDNEEGISDAVIQEQVSRPTDGAVFTRWGNITCPSSSELVYQGLVGGSYHVHNGGGAQYLCLPETPTYADVEPSVAEYRSFLYSTELQYPNFPPLVHLQHQDAACSVCRTLNGRTTVLMVPARNVCPKGWTKEYAGYLMTATQQHKRTEYLCVDSNPTPLRNGVRDQNGALLYPVEANCDDTNIPCPPYVQGYELTCAVCTK